MNRYPPALIILLAVSCSLVFSVAGNGAEPRPELSGSLEEDLTLSPSEAGILVDSETHLKLDTTIGGIDFASETSWGGKDTSDLSRQDIELSYDTEGFSTAFEAVFDPPRNGLDYLFQRGETEVDGVELTNVLLLEYVSEEGVYGSGVEAGFSGETGGGARLSGKVRFGMDEYAREVHDPTIEGSGYYIITDRGAGPSGFPFGSALIEISDVGLGPCTVGNRTKFMRGEGLLFSGFNFDLIDRPPLKTRAFVYFSDEGPTVTLVPTFQLGEGSWEFVGDFGGKLEGEDSALEGLEIRGIKLTNLSVGELEISATSAIAGKMKKEKGADQLQLHAEDYKLERSFGEIARDYLYEKVAWSDVLTLEYDYLNGENLKRYLGLDWYFKSSSGGPFDLAAINGVARWELSSSFSLGTSASLKTGSGLDRFALHLVNEF